MQTVVLRWFRRLSILTFIGISVARGEMRNGRVFVVDNYGKEMEITASQYPYRYFQQTFSYEAFLQIDPSSRKMALEDAMLSLDPARKLSAQEKIDSHHVLSVFFDPLSDVAKGPIVQNALGVAASMGNRDFVQLLLEKYVPKNTDRNVVFCELIHDVMMRNMTPSGRENDLSDFLKLNANTVQIVSTSIEAERNLPERPCKLSESDKDPLTLQQILAKVKAEFPTVAVSAPKTAILRPALKTPCKLAEIAEIFDGAVHQIEKYGSKHRVYLGMSEMNCPVYGLVVQDTKKMYRYYPDSYREDFMPAVIFKDGQDITKNFKPVNSPPIPASGETRDVPTKPKTVR